MAQENEVFFEVDSRLLFEIGEKLVTNRAIALAELIKNSYDALKSGGFAIHVMDKEDYETKEILLPNGQFAVPLERWKEQLNQIDAKYKEIPVKYGLAFIILKN